MYLVTVKKYELISIKADPFDNELLISSFFDLKMKLK